MEEAIREGTVRINIMIKGTTIRGKTTSKKGRWTKRRIIMAHRMISTEKIITPTKGLKTETNMARVDKLRETSKTAFLKIKRMLFQKVRSRKICRI